jgi:RNA polymerase sigma factor (sigma-70 family)
MYQLIFGIIRNKADTEDVLQEAVIKIYAALPLYQNRGLKTWLSRIAVNTAIDYKRKNYRIRELPASDPEDLPTAPLDLLPVEQWLTNQERRIAIHKNLNDMPSHYKLVINAYYYEQKTYQEISIEQDIPLKTVESQLYRAKQWLRERWKEEDFL